MRDRPVSETSMWHDTTPTRDIHVPGGIRTRNPSKRMNQEIEIKHLEASDLLFDCTILQEETERLIGKISRHYNWPVNKSQLGNKYIKHFIQFTNTIDFTKL
jgi:hypothetical protein